MVTWLGGVAVRRWCGGKVIRREDCAEGQQYAGRTTTTRLQMLVVFDA
jgi:hypothetical protein